MAKRRRHRETADRAERRRQTVLEFERDRALEQASSERVLVARSRQLSRAWNSIIASTALLVACVASMMWFKPFLVEPSPAPYQASDYLSVSIAVDADTGFSEITPVVAWHIAPPDAIDQSSTFSFGIRDDLARQGSIRLSASVSGSSRILHHCATTLPGSGGQVSVPVESFHSSRSRIVPSSRAEVTVESDEASSLTVIFCSIDPAEFWRDHSGTRSLSLPAVRFRFPTKKSTTQEHEVEKIWSDNLEPMRVVVSGGSNFQYESASQPTTGGYSRLGDVSWRVPFHPARSIGHYQTSIRHWTFAAPEFSASFNDVTWNQRLNQALLIAGLMLGLVPSLLIWLGNAVLRLRRISDS